jgi:hypothetical protein
MTRAQIISAVAAALAVPALLTGCVAVSNDTITHDVGTAVTAAVPEAHGLLVGLSYDGTPDQRQVLVKVYVGRGGSPDLASIANRTLKAAWTSFPVEPTSVGVDIVEGDKPADASTAQVDGVDLTDAAQQLGLQRWVGLGGIQVPSSEMAKKYGAWTAPK